MVTAPGTDLRTPIVADIATKALRQVREAVQQVLQSNGMDTERSDAIAEVMSTGRWMHDYPLDLKALQELGLGPACQRWSAEGSLCPDGPLPRSRSAVSHPCNTYRFPTSRRNDDLSVRRRDLTEASRDHQLRSCMIHVLLLIRSHFKPLS